MLMIKYRNQLGIWSIDKPLLESVNQLGFNKLDLQ